MSAKQFEIIYGINTVYEIIKNKANSIEHVYFLRDSNSSRHNKIRQQSLDSNIQTSNLEKKDFFSKLSSRFDIDSDYVINHQGVIALCEPSEIFDEFFLKSLIKKSKEKILLLILDEITDPHNLGACLRSADASGVDAVIIPKNNSVGLTGTVRKVACGAAETIPLVVVKNLSRLIGDLKKEGIWVIGATGEAEKDIYQIDFTGHTALVLGAEGKGMRRLTKENCDELFSIPIVGTVESLNVSVATGVALYEVLRQRR